VLLSHAMLLFFLTGSMNAGNLLLQDYKDHYAFWEEQK
jgi:hypothetical protein